MNRILLARQFIVAGILTLIYAVILLTPTIYAYDIELKGGESTTFTLSKEYDKYEILDNSTSLEQLTITKNKEVVTISAGFLIEEDTFRIVFYKWEEVIEEVNGGSVDDDDNEDSGCITEWICTDWSSCENELKTRECSKKVSYCGTNENKPTESETCSIEEDNSKDEESWGISDVIFWAIGVILVFFIFTAIAKYYNRKKEKQTEDFDYDYILEEE